MIPINQIIQGDALEVLKTFPDECVDLIITSPPYYSLRNYGVEGQIGLEETFDEYLDKILKITAELKRVLKKTGQLWWNHGDSYASHGSLKTRFWHGDNAGKHKLSDDLQSGRARVNDYQEKCLLLQPERLAIRMIDEQGWTLRNKVIWTKQLLLKKENKTIGSAMPTSVKDRFNETWEYLYFFVKNKKYYSNLDAVRLPFQYWGIVDNRPSDLILGAYRQKGEGYIGSKYYSFDFMGKSKKYKGKFLNVENPEAFNSPTTRPLRKSLKERMEDTKDKDTKQSRAYNVKKLLSEVRLGLRPNFQEARKKIVISPKGTRQAPEPTEPHAFHPLGKNIPSVHFVEEERMEFIPFSFEKQITTLGIKIFENFKNIVAFIENQLINNSFGMKPGTDISANNNIQPASDIIQEFFSSRKIQPNLILFRGNPYTTIAIQNATNKISIIFGRNIWIFCREGFAISNSSLDEGNYKWFAINCNSVISTIFPLLNWVSGFQLGTDYIKQLNVFRCKFKLKSILGNVTISNKKTQEISSGRSDFAKIFLVESILSLIWEICRIVIAEQSMVMTPTQSLTNSFSSTSSNRTNKVNSSWSCHILNLSSYSDKVNIIPSVWQINPEPHNFQKELGVETDHFAAFPQALCEIPIKFGCPEDGIVLDPFAGSGTALVVAKSLGRKYIGIELNPDYVKIAKRRLELVPDRLL